MKLFSYFRSSAAYRVRIALNLKNISHELEFVNLAKHEQYSTLHTAMNPQCLVPVLIDSNKIITQSIAIMEYLDDRFPKTPILPVLPTDRAKVRSFVQLIACEMQPFTNIRLLDYLHKGHELTHSKIVEVGKHWLTLGFEALEEMLEKFRKDSLLCVGDTVTMADICLIPQVKSAERFGLDMSKYKKIVAAYDYCMQLKPFIDASPEMQEDYSDE